MIRPAVVVLTGGYRLCAACKPKASALIKCEGKKIGSRQISQRDNIIVVRTLWEWTRFPSYLPIRHTRGIKANKRDVNGKHYYYYSAKGTRVATTRRETAAKYSKTWGLHQPVTRGEVTDGGSVSRPYAYTNACASVICHIVRRVKTLWSKKREYISDDGGYDIPYYVILVK